MSVKIWYIGQCFANNKLSQKKSFILF